MAVRQLPDGRWIVYYRPGTIPEDPRRSREYFGRGPSGEAAARDREKELDIRTRKPRTRPTGPLFSDLSKSYSSAKDFNPNSRKHLGIRLAANLLPYFGPMVASAIRDTDVRRYIEQRRRKTRKVRGKLRPITNATIHRELTDLKAILNWAVKQSPQLIPFNPSGISRSPRLSGWTSARLPTRKPRLS